MYIVCSACHAVFRAAISDPTLIGRTLTAKCKRCGAAISIVPVELSTDPAVKGQARPSGPISLRETSPRHHASSMAAMLGLAELADTSLRSPVLAPNAATLWVFQTDGQISPHHCAEDVLARIAAGLATPDSLVCQVGTSTWVRLDAVQEFTKVFNRPPVLRRPTGVVVPQQPALIADPDPVADLGPVHMAESESGSTRLALDGLDFSAEDHTPVSPAPAAEVDPPTGAQGGPPVATSAPEVTDPPESIAVPADLSPPHTGQAAEIPPPLSEAPACGSVVAPRRTAPPRSITLVAPNVAQIGKKATPRADKPGLAGQRRRSHNKVAILGAIGSAAVLVAFAAFSSSRSPNPKAEVAESPASAVRSQLASELPAVAVSASGFAAIDGGGRSVQESEIVAPAGLMPTPAYPAAAEEPAAPAGATGSSGDTEPKIGPADASKPSVAANGTHAGGPGASGAPTEPPSGQDAAAAADSAPAGSASAGAAAEAPPPAVDEPASLDWSQPNAGSADSADGGRATGPLPTALEPDVIESGFSRLTAAVRMCARAELRRVPGTQLGLITLILTVAPSGRVSDVAIKGAASDSDLARCIRSAGQRVSFPAFDGKPQVIKHDYDLAR